MQLLSGSKMKTLIKWPGGKGRELKFILPQIPSSINNYYEPFFGGGAVYFSLERVKNISYVNDASEELINFYKSIKNQNTNFFEHLNLLNSKWEEITDFFFYDKGQIVRLYNDSKSEKDIRDYINTISVKLSFKLEKNEVRQRVLEIEINKSLSNKFKRTKSLEIKRGKLPNEDLERYFSVL